MRSFLSEFTRNTAAEYTVIFMDETGIEPPRQHRVQPRAVAGLVAGFVTAAVVLAVALVVLTPVRELIPGYGTAELRREARVNALRVAALQDSLQVHQRYMEQMQRLIRGDIDGSDEPTEAPAEPGYASTSVLADVEAEARSDDWADHEQPALPLTRMPVAAERPLPALTTPAAGTRYLASLRLPAPPPVSGFVTRGFDARRGHYAVDIAVETGTVVRSIGDGYVIFADWTHDGGYEAMVQHANGYVSVYKHNQRLLKRVGDRVRDREAIAISGNSGETSTGPHLHFELWYDGLAQDPQVFLVGS